MQTISAILLKSALQFTTDATVAEGEAKPDKEMQSSLLAHLTMAIALEGLANDLSHAFFDKETYRDIERKCDTVLKWRLLTSQDGHSPLDKGKPHLQVVAELQSIRNNDLVHPKPFDMGNEIIIRSTNGNIQRNAPLDQKLSDGDEIHVSLGKLLDKFNAKITRRRLVALFDASIYLRDHLSADGLDWLNDQRVAAIKIKNRST
ncbi:MAG: hypothetical protein R3C59_15335 [Planctomycetaceae bacterium]